VLVQFDVDDPAVKPLTEKYGVRALPTFILLSGEEAVADAWLGFEDGAAWGDQLRTALADPAPIAEKEARFADTPDPATGRCLARVAEARGDLEQAVGYLERLAALDPERQGEYLVRAVSIMSWGVRTGAYRPDDILATAQRVLDDPRHRPADLLAVTATVLELADQGGEADRAVPFLRRAMTETAEATDPEITALRRQLAPAHALLVEQDGDKAVRLKKESMPEGWRDDPGKLNEFAWWCAQHGVGLAEAEALAHRGAELTTEPRDKANILDTLAEIQFKLGKRDEAVVTEERALALQPDSGYLKKQIARFKGGEAAD